MYYNSFHVHFFTNITKNLYSSVHASNFATAAADMISAAPGWRGSMNRVPANKAGEFMNAIELWGNKEIDQKLNKSVKIRLKKDWFLRQKIMPTVAL
ncbi:MAG: hypothetical protein K9H26_15475 [Prolixibacteraceae bacterium]|nr:hypothetical protein [Prolixibacteraceae bacterium]